MSDRWQYDLSTLTDAGWERFVTRGIQLSVNTESATKYKNSVRRFVTFLNDRHLPFAFVSLVRFLCGCRTQGARGGTLEGIRSAIAWMQRVVGMEEWACSAALSRAIKGFCYQDKLRRIPRGAVEFPMLEQLGNLDAKYKRAFWLAYFAVLRVGQLKRMLGGDAIFGEDESCILTIRRDKRCNANNSRELTSRKEVLLPEGKALLRALMAVTPHGQLVFPWFVSAEANAIIHRAAKHFAWPPKLQWDGMHCLRHGGAQRLKAFIVTLMARFGPVAAMATSTAQRYTKLNALRVELEEGTSSSDDSDDEGAV